MMIEEKNKYVNSVRVLKLVRSKIRFKKKLPFGFGWWRHHRTIRLLSLKKTIKMQIEKKTGLENYFNTIFKL